MKSWMQRALLFAVLFCNLLAPPTQIKAGSLDFAAQVFFAEPAGGAAVTSPVPVQMRARRFLLAMAEYYEKYDMLTETYTASG